MERLQPASGSGDRAQESNPTREDRHPLDVFFKPRTLALIGASDTPGSVGRSILWNLLSSPFGGTVYPVNARKKSVLGIAAYRGVAELPEPPELAVVAIPAKEVPAVVRECANAGTKGAIIISAGFKEAGEKGASLEQEVLDEARRGGIRIIGPNCLGVMSPLSGLNATFATPIALPGSVAFISQSGALCSAILDWSMKELVGFSGFVSVGSMADVDWGDLIDYFGNDPKTRSILLYMETIGDPRSFLSAARQVALSKPIILLKGGRTAAAAKAATSHTGALAGSDEVLDAALRRVGVLRVNSIDALFYMAEALARQPRPRGPRLAILTNAGGPGVLATDALIEEGCELATLSNQTLDTLNRILPPHWSHANPVDVLGDADADRYAKAVDVVSQDPNSDGLLVILSPQAMTDPTEIAERVAADVKRPGKPILACWMGGAQVEKGEAIFNRANIPTFAYPDTAVRAFHYMWRSSYNLHGLYETPELVSGGDDFRQASAAATEIVQQVRGAGRTLLTETESKQLLSLYGIPVVKTLEAATEDEAVRRANEIGYPVVLKLLSGTVTHKSDVGGVKLNLIDEAGVRRAFQSIQASVEQRVGPGNFAGVSVQDMVVRNGYEAIVGSTLDPQFGPVLLFGSGGQLVEIFDDHALALPPLNTVLARRMMEQTRLYRALQGVRGRKAADLEALEEFLVRFSRLVVAERSIREIDINPLLISPEGILALDARVVLNSPEIAPDELPRLAIRPYPTQYVATWKAKDGTPLTIRPVRPEDEPLVAAFHGTLSQDTVYRRYFHLVSLDQRISHDRLVRMCFIDYDREIALVAERSLPETGAKQIVAVGRLSKISGTNDAEVAVLVSDAFQNRGIGSELLRRLIEIARAEQIARIGAGILLENVQMQHLCTRLGFKLRRDLSNRSVDAVLEL